MDQERTPEQTAADQAEELAFEASFGSEDAAPASASPTPEPSASPSTAPAAQGDTRQDDKGEPAAAGQQRDELEALPPRLRAVFEQMERALPALSRVDQIDQRARKLEGRLGDLAQRIPTPAPTAAPRPQLPKVDAIRRDLPEVAEALDELLEHARASAPTPAPAAASATANDDSRQVAESEPLLDTEMPDWRQVVRSNEFDKWLDTQGQQYSQRIRTTDSEPTMLAAIARYKGEQAARQAAEQAAAAQAARVNQQRQARAAGAVVPTTGARRSAPASLDAEEDAFVRGFG